MSKKGQLVTRAENAERLWPNGVFVDTEHGINSFIRKIRLVLRDDSDQPRFVQTVTGKGYRFIAPITRLAATPNGAVAVSDSSRRDEPSRTDSHSTISETANQGVAPAPAGVSSPAEQNIETGSRANLKKRFQVAIALAMATAVAVGLVIGVWLHRRSASASAVHPQIRSLAVLPLDNLSGGSGQEYFADGMTDELTTMLAKKSTLRIVSRTSAMQYKGAHRPLREIAQALGVDGILEGQWNVPMARCT